MIRITIMGLGFGFVSAVASSCCAGSETTIEDGTFEAGAPVDGTESTSMEIDGDTVTITYESSDDNETYVVVYTE
jgi:hypothetical protein